jgi:uncharacterized protein YndB with AHSA1/START domain
MKNSLLFDFTVDKATNAVHVKREFDADQALVWKAFTDQEVLDQWWAPKPWQSRTKSMKFEAGGRRLYAMVGPEGEEHWAFQDFVEIDAINHFKYTDGFTDSDGNLNTEMPTSEWVLDFSEKEGVTTVAILIKHKSLADLELVIQLGFKDGFTMALDYLTGELLPALKS